MTGQKGTGRERLPFGGWVLWRHFVLRSAGFPFAALTEALSDPAASLADLPGFDWERSMAAGLDRALRLAGSDGVRQALLWQNPRVLELSVDWLRAGPASAGRRNARRRASEHTVVKYLQRYHAKNESVGFFGPVAWGTFRAAGSRIDARPGPAVRGRELVYFEDWAIDELGRAFATEAEIAGQLPPALAFGVTRLGRVLMLPDGGMRRLRAAEAGVVALIDGRRTAQDIAAELGWPARHVADSLAPLIADGLVTRAFDIPPEMEPEQALAHALGALAPGPAVARSLAALAALEAARAAVRAARTAPALEAALADVDELFSRLSGKAATRRRDEFASGRRPLAMQGGRDIQITLGPALADELTTPLALVLSSARWLARQAGQEFENVAAKVHRELAPLYADDAVPLNALISRLAALTRPGTWLDELVDELSRRWLRVLGPDLAAARVARSAASLAAAVRREFDGPAPGYAAGRHHSPDIMIAAAGPVAIEAGDFEFVLGELHIGMVTIDSRTFLDFAPDQDLARRCAELALVDGQPRFVPLHVRGTPDLISGWNYPPPDGFSAAYTYLSFGERIGERAVPGTRVPTGSAMVTPQGGRLQVLLPDGSRHRLLHALGEYVSYAVASRFRPMPACPHTPRVTVDRLVIARETWRIPVAEFTPLAALPEAAAFAGLRQLAVARGLPRHTFWRHAPGVKPVYLDLHSPPLAAVFVRELRRAACATIVFTEMYPGPGELWLPDAEGRRYTSELRLTVADTTPPEAP
ncbi:lantibiotic dehydratase [Trebonia sp.]|uniref:lantibiotic dehydratase n=1 Tax=Trebonia sp. TaxID=2767075 RepID=UPI0026255030|nr:lantibiotic dehydratase [Trebonia sp.]